MIEGPLLSILRPAFGTDWASPEDTLGTVAK